MIVLGCFGVGKNYCGKLKERYDNLKELLECIGILEGQIRYSNLPLMEAFIQIHQKRASKVSRIFHDTAKELSKMAGKPLYQIWKEQLGRHEKNIQLSKEDWSSLENLGKTLGIFDAVMQMNQLEGYTNQLKSSIEDAKIQWKEKERIIPGLGMISGMVLVLILI